MDCARPAFWWPEYYAGLREHLVSKVRCVLEKAHLVGCNLLS
jgi:hypothetical protein